MYLDVSHDSRVLNTMQNLITLGQPLLGERQKERKKEITLLKEANMFCLHHTHLDGTNISVDCAMPHKPLCQSAPFVTNRPVYTLLGAVHISGDTVMSGGGHAYYGTSLHCKSAPPELCIRFFLDLGTAAS